MWFWLRFLVFLALFGLWVLGAGYWVRCRLLGNCEPVVPIDSTELKKATHTLFLMVDGHPTEEGYPEMVFNFGSASPTYLPEHGQFLDRVADKMRALPQYRLLLLGRCTRSEAELSYRRGLYENLARARALALLEKLVLEKGIDRHRIEAEGRIVADDAEFSPMQFSLRPHTAQKAIELEAFEEEEEEVLQADTLIVPEEDSLPQEEELDIVSFD